MKNEKIEELIEGILRSGGRSVDASDLDPGTVSAIIEEYAARGWAVRLNGETLLFESKGERKLLKG